jgi:hypothetical protein
MNLNISMGGLGDQWMRLVALYTAAKVTGLRYPRIAVAPPLMSIGGKVFGSKLDIGLAEGSEEIEFTVRGIRDLIAPICMGRRFASPYARIVIRDNPNHFWKNTLNETIYRALDFLQLVQVPPWNCLHLYQGYVELVTLRKFRDISYDDYLKQSAEDYPELMKAMDDIGSRGQNDFASGTVDGKTIVFPSGSSMQFMPAWWAARNMPQALFAFHANDGDSDSYCKAGLQTVTYETAEEVVALARNAQWCYATDSFPSHLVQFTTSKATILLTEKPGSMDVHPMFGGKTIESTMNCSPCLKIVRTPGSTCQAGYGECHTWKNPQYATLALEGREPSLLS